MPPQNSLLLIVGSATIVGCSVIFYLHKYHVGKKQKKPEEDVTLKAYLQLIGNTPLVELPQLSKLTGCRIFAKVRFGNR